MASNEKNKKRRVGIIGFGKLGQYLINAVQESDQQDLAFVWCRREEVLRGHVTEELILKDLSKESLSERNPDLIVDVTHKSIAEVHGADFLSVADYMIGCPTALADEKIDKELRDAAHQNGLYVPTGAFWGGNDIQKMADRNTLKALKVTMTKHPDSLKLVDGELKERNAQVKEGESEVLYDGPVRGLCDKAPNNVNTMATAAIAAHNLGFDKVQGCLVSDTRMKNWHIVEVEVTGPTDSKTGNVFHVSTKRKNPAEIGAVTGKATYASFVSSMMGAKGLGAGVHLC
ncbi:aspartate dehydrogenase domain-containing protein-like [Antedon mediterranea]|uniref:aspartate dehydrogenase domain-containing protein-like n=1 Tax=Antedon mediterranea TaxID=105859 RepID=UPI003AF72000